MKEVVEILPRIKEMRGGNIMLYTLSASLAVASAGIFAYAKWA